MNLKELYNSLGEPVTPFFRNNQRKGLQIGESIKFDKDILTPCHTNLTSFFENLEEHLINVESYSNLKDITFPDEHKYLWIIDELCVFKMILEITPNPDRVFKPFVCHTNITEGKEAIQGGEIWIDKNRNAYINHYSGRYNHAPNQKFLNAIDFIKSKKIFSDITNISIRIE